jgi:hypothetical protein
MQCLGAKEWKSEGGDIFSRPLPNNAWGMPDYWEGGFELVRFDGKPGRNVTSREALEPNSYFLYKNQKELKTDPLHNTLYIRVPEGKTPDDVAVEAINATGGVYVGGNYVTVRNLISEFVGQDGFATHKNKGVVFENIEARFCMDQGISHHGADVVVRKSHFHHNAGGGVVDVYPEARTRYEQCLIESDTWRGGVEFLAGTFEMTNCIIRANPKAALRTNKGAKVKLKNCLLVSPELGKTTGVSVGDAATELEMENCTLYGFACGVDANLTDTNRLVLRRNAWVRCQLNDRIRAIQTTASEPIDLSARLNFSGNFYEPFPWEVMAGMKNETSNFSATEHGLFAARIGTDADAVVKSLEDSRDPLALPPITSSTDQSVGARLPQPFEVGPVSISALKPAN